jgi:hypothetical protein
LNPRPAERRITVFETVQKLGFCRTFLHRSPAGSPAKRLVSAMCSQPASEVEKLAALTYDVLVAPDGADKRVGCSDPAQDPRLAGFAQPHPPERGEYGVEAT